MLKEGTQNYQVLEHLKTHGSITSWQAFEEYGITRIGARIHELREMGFKIRTDMMGSKTTKKNYGLYVWEKQNSPE